MDKAIPGEVAQATDEMRTKQVDELIERVREHREKTVGESDSYLEITELLYDLSRNELRYLALECLEISDGVDSPMRKREEEERREIQR